MFGIARRVALLPAPARMVAPAAAPVRTYATTRTPDQESEASSSGPWDPTWEPKPAGGRTWSKAETCPRRSVIDLIRTKKADGTMWQSRELYDTLKQDPNKSHMRLHSFKYFEWDVLRILGIERHIKWQVKYDDCGVKSEGWIKTSVKRNRRLMLARKRMQMMHKRTAEQDFFEGMWADKLNEVSRDYDEKHEELSTMLERKTKALRELHDYIDAKEGKGNFE